MRKRLLMFMVTGVMAASLVGCGSKEEGSSEKKEENTSKESVIKEETSEKEEEKDLTYEEFMALPETPGSEFHYIELEDGTLEITYQGDADYLVIPEEIDGKKVTTISDGFYQVHQLQDGGYLGDRDGAKGIRLPDTVKVVRLNSFTGHNRLEYLVLGNGLEVVETFCFTGLESLKELNLPDTLTTIGNTSFSGLGCEGVVIPESVTHIGDESFVCDKLTEVLIKNPDCEIMDDAFLRTYQNLQLKVMSKPGGKVEEWVKNKIDNIGREDIVFRALQ